MGTPISSARFRSGLLSGGDGAQHLFDSHTHLPVCTPGESLESHAIYSLSLMDGEGLSVLRGGHWSEGVDCTVGLHPWDTARREAGDFIEELSHLLTLPQCVALGECGLDRRRGAELPLQRQYFTRQIELAQRMGKSLVIHCVAAWSELFSCIEKVGFTGCVALHSAQHLPESLLGRAVSSGWYLSYGPRHEGYSAAFMGRIPRSALLLESDGRTQELRALYGEAAHALGCGVEALPGVIRDNWASFKRGVRP